jgi:hypothetical protein
MSDNPAIWLDSSVQSSLYDAASGGSPVDSGGFVGRALDQSGNGRMFRQLASSARPGWTSGVGLTFNGSTQWLSQSAPIYSNRTTLPDGAVGAVTGKGWTCTGLVWDEALACWWVGNDGRGVEGVPGTAYPSVIQLSANLSTIISQIDVKALWADQTTVQGVCVDTTAGTLWFAALDQGKIRNISKAGALIGELTVSSPNGIAYDPSEDRLIVLSGNGTFRVINKTTGSQIRSYSWAFPTSPDMLYFDPATRFLYASYGANGSGGLIVVIDHDNPRILGILGPFDECLATEGIAIRNGKLYVCNDAYYHNQSPNLNEIVEYDLAGGMPIAGLATAITVAVVGRAKIPTAGSGSRGWITSGSPLNSNGTMTSPITPGGWALYAASGGAAIRMLVNQSSLDVTAPGGAGLTSDAIIIFTINAASPQASLFFNGGSGTSFTPTIQSGKIQIAQPPLRIGQREDATGFSEGQTKELIVFPGSPDRQKIEGYLAHKWSLQGLLPAGHPYKSTAP